MAKSVKIEEVLEAVIQQDAVIIDILEPDAYGMVHIKNAINIPVKNVEKLMPKEVDPESRIIIYGIDYEDPTARIVAEKAEEMGYKDVLYYPGGKKEWLETEMPVDKNQG